MFNKQRILAAALALVAAPLGAAPMLSVDMDPSTPGIDSSLDLVLGSSFTIELLLDTDGETIAALEFDLLPGSGSGGPVQATGIRMNDVLFGAGSVAGIPDTQVLESTLDNGAGEVAGSLARSLFGIAVNGVDLVVAAIDFTVLALGTFAMDLNDVLLFDDSNAVVTSAPPGDGLLRVSAPVSLSTPTSAVLILSGLLALSGGMRHRWLARQRPRFMARCHPGG